MARVFTPHAQCTVASGDCFNEGRCLSQCRAQAKANDAKTIVELERRLAQIERIVYGLRLHESFNGGRHD